MQYPITAQERRELRASLREQVMYRADREAAVKGFSIKCEGDRNRPAAEHQCKNNGTGCLCWCHDPGARTAPETSAS